MGKYDFSGSWSSGLTEMYYVSTGNDKEAYRRLTDGRFTMVLTRCSVVEPPAGQLGARQLECGIPFWPHGFVTAHCDINALLEHWTNEYACLGYGADLAPALVDFCELTGITAIVP